MSTKITLHETADGRVYDSQAKADDAERVAMLLHDMEEKQNTSDVNLVFYVGDIDTLTESVKDVDYIPNLLDGYRRLYDKYYGSHALTSKQVSAIAVRTVEKEQKQIQRDDELLAEFEKDYPDSDIWVDG